MYLANFKLSSTLSPYLDTSLVSFKPLADFKLFLPTTYFPNFCEDIKTSTAPVLYAYLLAKPVNHCNPHTLKAFSLILLRLNFPVLSIALAASAALSKGVNVFNNVLDKTFPCL